MNSTCRGTRTALLGMWRAPIVTVLLNLVDF